MLNTIIEGKGFYISYALAGSGPTGDETALVRKLKKPEKVGTGAFTFTKDKEFFILNGDWRAEYAKLVPKGYMACKKFFNSKKDTHLNFWSN